MPANSPAIDRELVRQLVESLPAPVQTRLSAVVDRIVAAKRSGGKVAVVTGSGPNLHEGVTTLIAELIRLGIVDGVTTSSAVVSHEMAGTLERVKRVHGGVCGRPTEKLPLGGHFELSLVNEQQMQVIAGEIPLDEPLIARLQAAEGEIIIKAAGNMAYPLGYRTERLALEVLQRAKIEGLPFEAIAGRGADHRTMIGAAARAGVPVLVSIPQLVGGGGVGLAIGDSISITDRAARVARLLAESEVIVESAVALTQEIHDGPFETYTGHGIWADWDGHPTFSLQGKTLVRIDLDPNLEAVCQIERNSASVQQAINLGLPKTKQFKIPFRMEMSGFARLQGSSPIIGDIGVIWPIIALGVADALQLNLKFLSYPQQSAAGRVMRETIVEQVGICDRRAMLEIPCKES